MVFFFFFFFISLTSNSRFGLLKPFLSTPLLLLSLFYLAFWDFFDMSGKLLSDIEDDSSSLSVSDVPELTTLDTSFLLAESIIKLSDPFSFNSIVVLVCVIFP